MRRITRNQPLAKNQSSRPMEDVETQFEKETAKTAFQLIWGTVKRLGISRWRKMEVSKAVNEYVHNYLFRHGKVSVLGMAKPIPLTQIYTNVRVVSPTGREISHDIDGLEEAFKRRNREHLYLRDKPAKSGIDYANSEQFLNVLGSPGAGKSTFLKKLGLEALRSPNSQYKHSKIPILVELRRFRKEEFSLEEQIRKELISCGFPSEIEGFMRKGLKGGEFLLLLDGLDEVPEERLDQLIENVIDFVSLYPKNHYVTSCRMAFYRNQFKEFTDVELTEFNDLQIKRFAENWFSSIDDINANVSGKFFTRLSDPDHKSSRELAGNPLLLTYLCWTFDRTQGLPNNRATLYSKALNILLEEWAAEKRVHNEEIYSGLHADIELDMLGVIAHEGIRQDRCFFRHGDLLKQIKKFLETVLNAPRQMDPGTVLEAIEIQQGIFVRRAEDYYSFSHLTIQEYLCARHISVEARPLEYVRENLFSHRWREVIILLSAIGHADSVLGEVVDTANKRIGKSDGFFRISEFLRESVAHIHDADRSLFVIVSLIEVSFEIGGAPEGIESLCFRIKRAIDPDLAEMIQLDYAFSILLEKEFSEMEVDSLLGIKSSRSNALNPSNLNSRIPLGSEDEDSIVEDVINEEDIFAAADYQDEIDAGSMTAEELAANLGVRRRDLFELLKPIDSNEIECYLYAVDLLLACRRTSARLSTDGWVNIVRDLF